MSSGPTPALGHRISLRVIAGDGRDRPVLVMHVEARLVAAADDAADQHQRLLQSRARSAEVTMTQVALSVSTQQSSRCSGLQMKRLLSTSSTVKRFL